MEVKDTSLLPSMIFPEKLGCIFYKKNHKLLLYLKGLKPRLKMKSEELSRLFKLIEVVNIAQKNLKHFVQTMAFEEN